MKPRRAKKFGWKTALGAGLIMTALPAAALAVTSISLSFPGQTYPTSSIGGYINNFYQFALIIGTLLAFAVVVFGGILYMTSGGNSSKQSDAKEWIEAAILGLLLLGGAYFILKIVNPNLVQLGLPSLTQVQLAQQGGTGGGGGGTGGGGTGGGQPTGCAGSGCQDLSAAGMTCKAASQQPNGQASCSAAPEMVNTLQCIQGVVGSGDFTVTEAMPPTVPHESSCHQDGCCVDVTVNAGNCAAVQQLMSAVKQCGGTAANEYASCGGTTYGTTDGNNVHINSTKGGGC